MVERLHDAGAVLVAKLAVGALARGGVWFGGTVQNPWDLNQTVNASSCQTWRCHGGWSSGFLCGVGNARLDYLDVKSMRRDGFAINLWPD